MGWLARFLPLPGGYSADSLKGHTTAVTSVALSLDGRRLASTNGDGTVKLWDLRTLDDKPSRRAEEKKARATPAK